MREESARLHGLWRLVSFLEERESGHWEHALGADAHGTIGYWPNGRMQVLIGARDRPRLRGDWSEIPAGEKARCFERMVAYAGRFSIEGDRVVHHVDTCWIPNWEGRDLVRRMRFPEENRLELATVVEPGAARVRPAQVVLWERI